MTGYPAPVVTWRKSSGPLPQGRVKYNNSALQILHIRKNDSDFYFCSASNLLGRVEKKTLLVVVSPPRFTVKPPAKVFPGVGSTLTLDCKATGDPQPVISWKKQDGQLPAGRSRQLINGTLVIRDITMNDRGIYKCIAPYARVFKTAAVTYIEIQKGIFSDIAISFLSFQINLTKTYTSNASELSLTSELGQGNRTVDALFQLCSTGNSVRDFVSITPPSPITTINNPLPEIRDKMALARAH